MKISYSWLKTLINTDLSIEDLCDRLTMSGLEVEHVERIESIKGGLEGLVIGEVLDKQKHPNADKLSLTKVDIGNGEALSIVCGAPNVETGQKVVVAPVGCTIYPSDGEPFTIKKTKIRGEESQGMLCAEDEIGLGSGHEGILVLDPSSSKGKAVKDLYDIETDHQIEIAIIPNRGDAVSHLGVAREIQALTGQRYKRPGTTSFDARGPMRVDIDISNNDACPRYAGISISSVKVAPSPDWLQNRLKGIGLNPINNVVDITNYIQHEIGQPIHAFDLDKIEGQQIHVRNANEDESFITLDGEERKLKEFNLVIADAQKPMALAGVLGGLDSGVTDITQNIFIESAYFNPSSIRKTAKHFGINSDASYRYERGTDPNIIEYALRRVVNLVQEICGGDVASEIVDIYPNPIPDKEIAIKLQDLNSFTGHTIEKEEVIDILQNLEIKIAANNGENLMLHVPPYRPDVDRPVDIYEEILRIYGFDNIPIPSKVNYIPSVIEKTAPNKLQSKIANYLADLGFYEIINNSLHPSANYSEEELKTSIKMLNPLSQEMDILRMDMMHSALSSISYNLNRKNADLKFFEFGKVYQKIDDKYIEQDVLQISATGKLDKEHWSTSDAKIELQHLRGVAQNILTKLNIGPKQFKKIIKIRTVDGKLKKRYGLKQEVHVLDLDWTKCLHLNNPEFKLTDIPKFPVVRRDLSLILDHSVAFTDIKQIADQSSKGMLRSLNVFDVYKGKPLEENQKSISLAFYLYNEQKTMEDKEIDHIMEKMINNYEQKLNAVIRK
ncbi:MAG: phenylalanine--tRNA ligase subunit beta [Bacteroidia bacterium]